MMMRVDYMKTTGIFSDDAGCREWAFGTIIAKSQSRFTRNLEHSEKYLHHKLPLWGVRFIGVVDGVDTMDENNKMTRQVKGLTNEWYCETLSKNVRSVFLSKMNQGKFVGFFMSLWIYERFRRP